ncbi:MAG: hypothetical protein ABH852_00920, partial [Methanobacteriota archaeon]
DMEGEIRTEEEIKRLNRSHALLKAITSGIKKSFVPEHGKLDDDDFAHLLEHYATRLPVGKMLEVFERVKLKRLWEVYDGKVREVR